MPRRPVQDLEQLVRRPADAADAFRARSRAGAQGDDHEADGPQVDLVHYLKILYMRRWTAAAAFIIVMLIATIRVLTATPIYQASARLLIEADRKNVVSFQE